METEVFIASSKGVLKALGIDIAGDIKDVHILVDGVDISKVAAYEEVRIVLRKEEQSASLVAVTQKKTA